MLARITLLLLLISSIHTTAQVVSSDGNAASDTTEFTMVEKSAEYPGRMSKFYEYISANIRVPKSMSNERKPRVVYIEFVINRDGSIDDASVKPDHREFAKKDPRLTTDPECEAEAIRLMQNCSNWIPASTDGKAMKQKMVIPIMFIAK